MEETPASSFPMEWISVSIFEMGLSGRLLIIFIFLSGPASVFSQECTLQGQAADYAGLSMPVYIIENPISRSHRTIDTLQFNQEGEFRLLLDLQKTMVIYFDLGKFTGYIYAEPGYEYTLLLPPYIKRTHQNDINPFYRQSEVLLNVMDCIKSGSDQPLDPDSERNNLILQFDTTFNRLNEEVILKRQSRLRINADSLINMIEDRFSFLENPFFERYRRYRYGLMKINEGQTGLGELSRQFMWDPVPRTNEPAYMDLFNAIFDDFLLYYARTEEGKSIPDIINRRHSLSELRKTIGKHPAVFSDTIADLVILKNLYEQYYENYFIKDAILIILDSLKQDPSLDTYRFIAGDLYDGFSRLMIGNEPPQFSLRDQHGKLRSEADFKGKYVYLYFCTPDNYSCMSEYPFLKSFYEKHRDYLEIVTIMISESYNTMVTFMQKNHYEWTALYYNDQPDILEKFNIRFFPTAFLLAPDGTLVQSPATLPSEGFQQQLFRIMRSRGEI